MPQAPQTFPPIGELLKRQGIWLDKRKAQHFLRDQEMCSRIADLAGLTPQHLVVEVGSGLGNLSVELAARAGEVRAVELDRSFQEWHQYLAATYRNLRVQYEDFLKVDLEALIADRAAGTPVAGVGNLPYQVTSEILFRFVDAATTFDVLVFMVQREVAERVCAGPATRESGALTYKIALRYRAELALRVPPGAFLPPPKVDSAVMVLRPLAHPLFTDPAHRQRVYTLLDRVFNFRRKTIVNGLLMGGMVQGREAATRVLGQARIDEKLRPEALTLAQVLTLEQVIHEASR